MSDSPQHLTRSIGWPFWIGCLVGPILFFIQLAASDVLHDRLAFYLFGGVAVFVFGPVGGAVFQAAHDLFIAGRLGLLRVWDFLVFAAIAVALVVAGEALFHAPGSQADIHVFQNRTFDIAVAFVALMLVIYAISKNLGPLLSFQTWMAILLIIAMLGFWIVVYKLTGFNLGWIMVIGTAVWAAVDSTEIQLSRYESGISYRPAVLFCGLVLLWAIVFPWYLIVRHRIKIGTAVLKNGDVA